ncbi:MAG: RNA methyltransferase [Cyanobacteria bacterium P01_E01_bin.45]
MDSSLILTSIRNPWIKQLRQLQRKKGRREQGYFVVEGTHALQEAIATGWPLSAICFTPQWLEKSGQLLDNIENGVRQQLVGNEVLAAIASTQAPDGVVTICHHRESQAEKKFPTLGIAVETLQDPGNLGTLIRSAAAVDCDGIWLSADSVDPENPKVLRSSAGQWFRQPPIVTDLPTWLQNCRQHGVRVLAATAGTSDIPASSMWNVDLTLPAVFLLGNEGAGLSPELRSLADGTIAIPMAAGVESLNVGIAGSLLLYEAKWQRQL